MNSQEILEDWGRLNSEIRFVGTMVACFLEGVCRSILGNKEKGYLDRLQEKISTQESNFIKKFEIEKYIDPEELINSSDKLMNCVIGDVEIFFIKDSSAKEGFAIICVGKKS